MKYVIILRVALCVFALGISGFLDVQADDAIGKLYIVSFDGLSFFSLYIVVMIM